DAHFQANGLQVPNDVTSNDLARLTLLIETLDAKRLLILGDFLHGAFSQDDLTLRALSNWRDRHKSINVTLVRGNHDRHAGDPHLDLRFEISNRWEESSIVFIHEGRCKTGAPSMSGHVHPTARLSDFDGSSLSLPCFVVEESLVILPAFGRFTGGYRIAPEANRRLFIASHGRVLPVI
ncbi:MAG TPA: ligase-associated DNA damage response endonuclease PdeM, partial [Tepidisphaeraceae bacterium]|nr:ligase-associated DNA damage response endonuclease PdeM [Tepidisphaeraceae bacterium]